MHRPRGVDHEDQFARPRRAGSGLRVEAGRHHHDQQVAVATDLFGENGGLRQVAFLRHPFEDEIAIRRDLAVAQGDGLAAVPAAFDHHRVIEAAQRGQRQPGVQVDGEAERIISRCVDVDRAEEIAGLPADLRRCGRIDAGVAVVCGLCGLRLGGRRVARRHHHGKAQGEDPILVADRVLVADIDGDVFARADVGQRCHEDVGAFAADQAGALAVVGGVAVDPLGRGLLQDAALHPAFADHHGQAVDGGAFRQREDVDSFQPAVGGIVEDLTQGDPGDHAVHGHPHIRPQGRRFQDAVRRPVAEIEAGGVLVLCAPGRVGLGRPAGQEDGAQQHEDRQHESTGDHQGFLEEGVRQARRDDAV